MHVRIRSLRFGGQSEIWDPLDVYPGDDTNVCTPTVAPERRDVRTDIVLYCCTSSPRILLEIVVNDNHSTTLQSINAITCPGHR